MKNPIQGYNNIFYKSGPIKVSDYISNHSNKIHQKLYKNAMDKFLEEHSEIDRNKVKIIERKNPEYWLPSYITVIDYTSYPRSSSTYWLGEYWDNIYVDKAENKYIDMTPDKTSEIDYLNYIKGTAKMVTKYDNTEFEVDFSQVDGSEPLTDNYDVYRTTFTYKMIHNNE